MGPNGSGKSTLAHALMGRPGTEVTAGCITHGRPRADRAAGLGAGPGRAVPGPAAPGRGARRGPALAAGRRGGRRHRERRRRGAGRHLEERMDDEAKAVGLDARLLRRPLNVDLSGGERKRTEMVQLGVLRPAVCILDEVDSGLDVDALGEVARRLQHATTEWGVGLLAITHFNRFLVQLEADLVHVLVDGRIVATGDAALALELEQTGYAGYQENAEPRRPTRGKAPAGHLPPPAQRRLVPFFAMANGRPPGDGSDRSPGSVAARHANQEGLAALGRQMRWRGPRPRGGQRVGPAALGRADRLRRAAKSTAPAQRQAQVEQPARRSSSRSCALIVLMAAVVGGGYGYLWYRYNQINKVHIADEVAAASGAPFTILVIGSDSRVGESSQALRLVLRRDRSAQRRRAAVAGDPVGQDDPGHLHPARHRRHHAAAGHLAVRHVQPHQLVLQLGGRPAGQDDHGQLRHPDQPRRPGRLRRLPGRGQRAGRHLPRLPVPGQGLLLGAQHHDARLPAPQRFQALAVARARHYEYYANGYWQYDGTSDFGRIQRQDVFLRSLITSAKSKVNPLTVNAFIGSIHEGVTIDDGFGFNELIGLALDYRSFDPANLQAQTLPTVAANGFGDLGDVLTVHQPAAQQMLVNIFGSDLQTPTNPPPDADGDPDPPR